MKGQVALTREGANPGQENEVFEVKKQKLCITSFLFISRK